MMSLMSTNVTWAKLRVTFADVAVRDAARLRQVLAALPLMSNENLKEVDTKVKEQMKRRK